MDVNLKSHILSFVGERNNTSVDSLGFGVEQFISKRGNKSINFVKNFIFVLFLLANRL